MFFYQILFASKSDLVGLNSISKINARIEVINTDSSLIEKKDTFSIINGSELSPSSVEERKYLSPSSNELFKLESILRNDSSIIELEFYYYNTQLIYAEKRNLKVDEVILINPPSKFYYFKGNVISNPTVGGESLLIIGLQNLRLHLESESVQ